MDHSALGTFYTTDPALQTALLESEAAITCPNNDESSSECSSDLVDESDTELTSDNLPLEENCTDYDEESVLEDLVGRYYQRTVGTQQEGPARGAQRSAEREAELQLTELYHSLALLTRTGNIHTGNVSPGVRPKGIGEISQVLSVVGGDIYEAAGSVQPCSGQASGVEAAVHAMNEAYHNNTVQALLLVDASNAFNCHNCQAALCNFRHLGPSNLLLSVVQELVLAPEGPASSAEVSMNYNDSEQLGDTCSL